MATAYRYKPFLKSVWRPWSLDHPIGASQDRRRDCQAEGLRCAQIDDQLEPCRLLDGEVGGLGPLENLVHEGGEAPKLVRNAGPIGHEATGFDVVGQAVYHWHATR